jgi:hypothetical protein
MGFYFALLLVHLKNQGHHDEVIRGVSGGIGGLISRGFGAEVAAMRSSV